ncbi:unnamed protein product [Darwinula stevensoni]|uniref:EGF-like domain-containing protein n=1 Tax=Darwinula stevensoni TaxID=69355 RepID=A0A7R9A035_9CRUS|nr:unnamed protein product [Darwinula stevensoni]CAG0880174.1 unnamed protein product [Darwinula stevensoni]
MNLFLVLAASASILRSVDAREAPGLGEPCEPGVDTCRDWNAECVGEDPGGFTCECVHGFVQDGGNCKVPPGGLCSDSLECVSNAECDGFGSLLICSCLDGFVDDRGFCKVEVGGPCRDADECVTNADCLGEPGTCQCEEGFLEESGLCREAPRLGEACDPDGAPCEGPNEECLDDGSGASTCRCQTGFVEDEGVCKVPAGGPCTNSTQCVSDAQCTDMGGGTVCTCNDGHVEVNGRCKVALGGECQDTVECVENAECVDDTCQCMQGFQEHFGECVPEDDLGLGESCDPMLQNCVTENAECVGDPGSATCQCMEGFLQEGDNCEAWNPGLGEPCDPELAPCTAENTECVGEPGSQTCQCEEGLVQDGEICRMPFLGEECDPGRECAAENSDCLEHAGVWTCQCSMGFVQEQADCTDRIRHECHSPRIGTEDRIGIANERLESPKTHPEIGEELGTARSVRLGFEKTGKIERGNRGHRERKLGDLEEREPVSVVSRRNDVTPKRSKEQVETDELGIFREDLGSKKISVDGPFRT